MTPSKLNFLFHSKSKKNLVTLRKCNSHLQYYKIDFLVYRNYEIHIRKIIKETKCTPKKFSIHITSHKKFRIPEYTKITKCSKFSKHIGNLIYPCILKLQTFLAVYAKNIRPNAKRNDRITRPRRAQICERSELRGMRMCPLSGQIFTFSSWMTRYWFYVKNDFRKFHQIFTF